MQKLFTALELQDKSVILSIIRLFKSVLQAKDENFIKYIIAHKLFDPIFNLIINSYHKKNMINSVLLELLDIILKEKLKKLIIFIVIIIINFFLLNLKIFIK